jgi:tRNA-2-methylthio-N6-dimethylallyladenosine synthase
MKRRYEAATYRELAARIRSAVPSAALSSDFIVGFPGETEEDFEATLDLVRRVRFDTLFAFRYSPRPGTASARWGSRGEVPEEVSADRLARLLSLQTGIQEEGNRALEGREFEVLIEGVDRKGQSRGRTACNRIVHIAAEPPIPPGSYVRARIRRGLPNSLLGEVVGETGDGPSSFVTAEGAAATWL